jgi:putative selenium metabolism hydrolase
MEMNTCIEFVQRLIQTESLSGQEAEIGRIVFSEMKKLGYDEVYEDEAGNIIGLIRGTGQAPAVMFNTHLDHVDVGDPAQWPYPPFGGEIHQDRIWGRGAMDIKGPLAAQVYGIAKLISAEGRPANDVFVTAVVQEEVGGMGARHLATHLKTPLVVVGEATGNQLRRGHRGRTELVLHVRGKSVHASVPENGVNPLEVVAGFIQGIPRLRMNTDEDLGTSSVAPTLIRTDQISPNVVPAEVWLTCDWRRIASESKHDVQQTLQDLADRHLIEGASAEVTIPSTERTSFTGLKMEIPSDHPPFLLSADDPVVVAAHSVLEESSGGPIEVAVWKFATDGGHFAEAGMKVIGYGPGEEILAHTKDESLKISELKEAVQGNFDLARYWAAKVG